MPEQGMFDFHVHCGPDVWPRLGDDTEVVDGYEHAGFTGCVLKHHYDCTAGRAAATGRGRRMRVYGSLTLNGHVGGLNPTAVAAALRMGARVIWMPTTDAHTQQSAGLPRLSRDVPQLPRTTFAIPPLDHSGEDAVRLIVELIADADAVLATGHLSAEETAWLLPVAREAGVRRLVITHPSWTIPMMTAEQAAQLCEAHDAFAEITAIQLHHQPGCDADRLTHFVRAFGTGRLILSSDSGQPGSSPAPDALSELVDELAARGLDRGALHACASELPQRLVETD